MASTVDHPLADKWTLWYKRKQGHGGAQPVGAALAGFRA